MLIIILNIEKIIMRIILLGIISDFPYRKIILLIIIFNLYDLSFVPFHYGFLYLTQISY